MEPRKCMSWSLISLVLLAGSFLAAGCSDSESPTSPGGTAQLSGTLIGGSGASGIRPQSSNGPLPNVTVTVVSTGRSTQTDAGGNFTLGSVPAGRVKLKLKGAAVDANVTVELEAYTAVSVVIAASGSSATVVSQTQVGHVGEEIEGIVQTVDAAGQSLTVYSQRLGTVTVTTTASTVIRKGQTAVALADIQSGWRVHVKAALQSDGTYLAAEIIVQNTDGGGDETFNGEIEGIVQTVNGPGGSLTVLDQRLGNVTVMTTTSTVIRKGSTGDSARGHPARLAGAREGDSPIGRHVPGIPDHRLV